MGELYGQKSLLRVVVLDYLANGPDGWQILVHAIRVEIVQRVRGAGISIRASEVNAHLKPNNIHLCFRV